MPILRAYADDEGADVDLHHRQRLLGDRAMLLAVRRHHCDSAEKIRTVACPGLGTAAGRVPPGEAARQMALAYGWYVRPSVGIDWPTAEGRQAMISRGGDLMVGGDLF